MAKHFLYLTNDRLISLVWNRGAITSRESFLSAEAVSASCVAYIEKYRHLPTYLITDLVEEDFRLDTIPHLRASDSEAVINRKLSQIYRSSNLRHAIIQGREEEGRRGRRVRVSRGPISWPFRPGDALPRSRARTFRLNASCSPPAS